jgi:SH3 domain protein
MKVLLLFCAALQFIPQLAQAQTVRYITDQLRLEARSGPSTGHRIVRMLESGTEVTVLEESEGYSRLRLGNDSEAWILSRYLTADPPVRDQLAKATADLQVALQENAQFKAALESAQTTGSKIKQDRRELNQNNQRLSKELAQIRRTAASSLAIEEQNKELQLKVVDLERELQLAQQEKMSLSDKGDRDWFLTGAGVLLGGLLIGLIIPRLYWKRRRGWGEL